MQRSTPRPSTKFPAFKPRLPWITPHLQTLRNYLLKPQYDLSAWPAERMSFPTRDNSGDVLIGEYHRPSPQNSRPLVILIHGLTGSAESTYLMATAHTLLTRGYPVLRMNLRSAGASRRLCRHHYHAGRSEDLATVVDGLSAAQTVQGIYAIGYSLGANILIKYLAEQGAQGAIQAAVSISAPIDLKAACLKIGTPRNAVYQYRLLRDLRQTVMDISPSLPASQRAELEKARSIYDFDHCFVAPGNGFSSADDYYAKCSGNQFLPNVRVPTLLVQALDDPWIPKESYTNINWRGNATLIPLLSPRGGHVGFHAQGSRIPWHDQCVVQFLAHVESIQN